MDRVFTINSLGSNGRFGNQIFQFCLAQALAQKYDAQLYLPGDWIGRKIFKINNPVSDISTYDCYGLDVIPNEQQIEESFKSGIAIDIWGYFQNQKSIDLYSAPWVRETLQFKDWIKELFPKNKYEYYACHKRRGDYVNQPNHYCSIADSSFDAAIDYINYTYNIWNGYILTEEEPITNARCESMGCPWLPDFMCMVNATWVIRSNSTFSYWPSIFGENQTMAPVVTDLVGFQEVKFIEGNWPRFADSKHHPVELTDLRLREY